jgi:undecaprenyl-diphosphatase
LVGGALLLTRRSSRAQRALVVAAAILGALAVAASRLVLDVHWASDVAAGFAVGTSWAVLVLRIWPAQGIVSHRGQGRPSGTPPRAA